MELIRQEGRADGLDVEVVSHGGREYEVSLVNPCGSVILETCMVTGLKNAHKLADEWARELD